MRPLLCISGKRFSGKDTFAAFLRERARAAGVELDSYAFAAESKRMFVAAQKALGVDVDLDRLTADRAYKEEWRPKLTRFTVDSIQADPLVFCREVAKRIEASPRPALVTDLRLRLEVDYLAPKFALHVVRLARSNEKRAESGWKYDAAADEHHTETELDDPALWTEIVTNDGSAAELSAKAEKVIRAYLGASAAPHNDR